MIQKQFIVKTIVTEALAKNTLFASPPGRSKGLRFCGSVEELKQIKQELENNEIQSNISNSSSLKKIVLFLNEMNTGKLLQQAGVDYREIPDTAIEFEPVKPLIIDKPEDARRGGVLRKRDRDQQEDRLLLSAMPAMDEYDAASWLKKTVEEMAETTRLCTSTSRFTGAIITKDGKVVTAHLGDSPAVAIIYDPASKNVSTQQLINPHLPNQDATGETYFGENEARWVEKEGYLFPDPDGTGMCINVTHALGANEFGEAVSKEPDIKTHTFEPGKRIFLLVGSDGLLIDHNDYAMQKYQSALRELLRKNPDMPPQSIANSLAYICAEALGKQRDENGKLISQDNFSLGIMEVTPGRPGLIAVLDGGNGAEAAEKGLNQLEMRVLQLLSNATQQAQPDSSTVHDTLIENNTINVSNNVLKSAQGRN